MADGRSPAAGQGAPLPFGCISRYTSTVSEKQDIYLPLHRHRGGGDAEAPSCAPTAYVSNEEAAIFSALLALREAAAVVRGRLDAGPDDGERSKLEAELERLRGRREDLVGRREKAYVRKMIMLGHLPPDTI